jgi:hypothetical protein
MAAGAWEALAAEAQSPAIVPAFSVRARFVHGPMPRRYVSEGPVRNHSRQRDFDIPASGAWAASTARVAMCRARVGPSLEEH